MANGPGDKTQMLPVVGLGELFAMPLIALIDADAYAAEKTLDFIKKFAFEQAKNSPDKEYGSLRTITFSYQRTAANGNPEMVNVSIPLISLVPLPLLGIRKADMSFGVNIVGIEADTQSDEESEPNRIQSDHRARVPSRNSILRSRVARKPKTLSQNNPTEKEQALGTTDVHMEVNIEIAPADQPEGISRLLFMAGEGARAETVVLPRITLEAEGDEVIFTKVGQSVDVTVTLLTAEGEPLPGETIVITQDSDALFTLPGPLNSNDSGQANFNLKLASLPTAALPVIRQIAARANVAAAGYGSIELTGEMLVEIAAP